MSADPALRQAQRPELRQTVLPELRQWMDAVGADLSARVCEGVPLAPYTTLRVGGPADALIVAETEDELVRAAAAAQTTGIAHFILAGGSNLCISDRGIRGLVIRNRACECALGERTQVASGHALMSLALSAAEAGLSGLEFAIGIPGSVGGALVSNVGAYRRGIAPLIRRLRIVASGKDQWVEPEWMEFGYRDSRLRRPGSGGACLVGAELELTPRPRADILAEARRYQHNRVHRQPWGPSAGSFFKNVCDGELARRLPNLPEPLREAGVVPAGYLSEACGCRGLRQGGAQISPKHGNFIVNTGGATAADIRSLADEVKRRVYERFGAQLEEEVIYAGEW